MKKWPTLVILEAVISNGHLPEFCGECRFWVSYQCLLKPTLRCGNGEKRSRGCPLCVRVD